MRNGGATQKDGQHMQRVTSLCSGVLSCSEFKIVVDKNRCIIKIFASLVEKWFFSADRKFPSYRLTLQPSYIRIGPGCSVKGDMFAALLRAARCRPRAVKGRYRDIKDFSLGGRHIR